MVKLLIDTFGSPTDYDQLKDQYLQDEDKEEPQEGTDPKEEDMSLFTVPLSSSTTELKDICLLEAAKPAFPSNPLLISTARVPAEFISDNMPSGPNKQSTYYCLLRGCNTSTLQKASLCSHIHRKYLAMAIQCHFCGQAWWRSNPFLPHMRTKHPKIEPTDYYISQSEADALTAEAKAAGKAKAELKTSLSRPSTEYWPCFTIWGTFSGTFFSVSFRHVPGNIL